MEEGGDAHKEWRPRLVRSRVTKIVVSVSVDNSEFEISEPIAADSSVDTDAVPKLPGVYCIAYVIWEGLAEHENDPCLVIPDMKFFSPCSMPAAVRLRSTSVDGKMLNEWR